MAACGRHEVDRVMFQDVTESAGLAGPAGMTHGAAWGDYDGDGRPDLYVTNHLHDAQLFRNLGNGRFADVTAQVFDPAQIHGDKHGADWGDFDNDGHEDLVQLTGAGEGVGAEPKKLFHNLGGHLVDEGKALGIDNPLHRARTPLWVDVDNDGRLDLFEGAEGRLDHGPDTPYLFRQTGSGFIAQPADDLPMPERSTPFCMLAQLTADGHRQLLCRLEGVHAALRVFDLDTLPARSLDLLPQTAFEDLAIADFDNSGRFGVFMARKNPAGAVALGRPTPQVVVGSVSIGAGDADQEAGFTVHAGGPLHIDIRPTYPADSIAPAQVHLGSDNKHPAALSFDVGSDLSGLGSVQNGKGAGVYIGHTAPDQWEVRVTAAGSAFTSGQLKQQQVQVRVSAPQPIEQVQAVGKTASETAPARLFIDHDGRFVDESDKRGVNARSLAAVSVVAGDFDNDMHTDLFIVASGEVGKEPNLLLLNNGHGGFDVVKSAGGAAGGTAGVGDCVAAADFDGDGFLDLLVASGGSMGRSFGQPAETGGYRLYRNVGNHNHWVEIDLQGTKSNRDGIGAVVQVVAGGVTQTQLEDGGQHNRCQNFARLHFGLAGNTRIDRISIAWPSGKRQDLRPVGVDKLLRIREPG